jgi:uncharacterized protein
MLTRLFNIQNVREHTGWAYSEMKWLSEAEAEKANRAREKLLESISGRTENHFNGNKISTGPLSPGCMTCGQGTWSCIFIGSLCTANCFYCPQDRKDKTDRPPTESGLLFDDPDDYVDYLERLNFRGFSFSGGEPLLKFERVLSYIKKARERLGRGIYIWLYTNGDLVDENKLSLLREAGLNEIRFDIAARKYDLKGAKMAAGIIDTVTVEIPAVPEDERIVRKCLSRMVDAGVAHLNLHQLHPSPYSYRHFAARGYTFLHQPEIAVLESEMTALRIVKYALDHDIRLPINYCSLIYKHRLQKRGYRERLRPLVQEGFEGSTESGFIRGLSIQGTPANIRNLIRLLRERDCPHALWSRAKNGTELAVHHSLLKHIDFSKCSLMVSYFMPRLTQEPEEHDGQGVELALNPGRRLYAGKDCRYQAKLTDPAAIKAFRQFFIEKRKPGEVLKQFYRTYALKTKADIDRMMNDRDRLDYLMTWEFIGSGLHELY